ncbi:Endonuclease domain-containing 1 protein [Larimichthys crocea]|uniref:Endonuclease domain-containing 1 protein n=1 Tax=Larimichthys crocea TaxID=215358 RepID=A0A6G0J908_LARCR|nr:Endonuclease domain-containing 1 protein [Larimichthys crocea]
MTSLKTKNICFLPAFLFLAIVPTLAEVVNTVQKCNQFFRQQTPPNIPGILEDGKILDQNRYKVLCQTYENSRWYVTVYDTRNKIPVFSAYKYQGPGQGQAEEYWKIEPQLENEADPNKNMMEEEKGKTYTHQAMVADYVNSRGLDKGHCFPALHGFTNTEKTSTYTLTNIVPQAGEFNQGRWNTMEKCIGHVMDDYISRSGMECFVVVGAQPSANDKLNNKINIPSVMWSAFYCNNQKWSIAGAHWDNNVPGSLKDRMIMKPVKDLEDNLMVDAFPKTNPEFVDKKVIKRWSSLCKAQ